MTSPELPAGRARLADVARLAGVSTPTASKILNGVAGVSARPETRQRVLEAARELGYRPSVTARALAGAPTRALALMVEDLTRPMHSRTIRGVYSAGVTLGYTILIVEDGPEGNDSIVDLVNAGHVDGVIVASARNGRPLPVELARNGVPHVFLNRAVDGSGRNVTMRLDLASELVVAELARLGHRAIGHIAGPANVESARSRARSFERSAKAHGVARRPITHAFFDERSGASAAVRLLDADPSLTALYASSTSQAAGAISVATCRGLRIPEDVSIIAYGEAPLAAYLNPPLDTVAMPLEEMGRSAVIALVEQIGGAAPEDVLIETEPFLVPRGSIGPAPERRGRARLK